MSGAPEPDLESVRAHLLFNPVSALETGFLSQNPVSKAETGLPSGLSHRFLVLLHVVAPQHVLLAQVKFSADNGRMVPAILIGVGDFERPAFLVTFGIGVYEGDVPVGIAHV